MPARLHRRTVCRLCDSSRLELVVPFTPSPIADAYVPADRLGEPQQCYPLDWYQCRSCGHVQLLDVVETDLLFRHYSYFSGRSAGLVKHFQQYAEDVIGRTRLQAGSLVVDIGSNDGCFLRFFQERGMRVLGIDPAENVARVANESGIETWPAYFDVPMAERIVRERGRAQVVAANNVFAHTDDMAGMADAVRHVLADDGVFVFEVSYLLDVIDHMLLGTIFHEHLCYHSVTPLAAFLRRRGLELIDVARVGIQGGSLIGMAQRIDGPRQTSPTVPELEGLEDARALHDPATLRAFSARLEAVRREVSELIDELARPHRGRFRRRTGRDIADLSLRPGSNFAVHCGRQPRQTTPLQPRIPYSGTAHCRVVRTAARLRVYSGLGSHAGHRPKPSALPG
jgi:SAM-dependent methyltransferase